MTTIVIGANYGDEGKGLMTDYLVRKHQAKDVTRFNGGAQAGHTVVADGRRQVFNTYSSGTLAGAQTRLGSQFIINPFAIVQEHRALKQAGFKPANLVVASRDILSLPITTPFDVWLNQEAEAARGKVRHGSCGLGINETITRHSLIDLSLEDVSNPRTLSAKLKLLTLSWLPERCFALGIEKVLTPQKIAEMQDGFMYYANELTPLIDIDDYMGDLETAVYEGAQGLALDQTLGAFPHVTRSNTGIYNALDDICNRMQDSPPLEVIYVTRPYLTRHGAGPLAHECGDFDILGKKVVDETNIPNPWQGTLRFAPLNLPELARRIYGDLGYARFSGDYSLAITCADQAELFEVIAFDGANPALLSVEDIAYHMQRFKIKTKYISRGPSALDVQEVKEGF
jgi:adenylosuccinate synthase